MTKKPRKNFGLKTVLKDRLCRQYKKHQRIHDLYGDYCSRCGMTFIKNPAFFPQVKRLINEEPMIYEG